MLQLTPQIDHTRPDIFGNCPVTEAVKSLSVSGTEARGAIFTRPEVVNFMLDLAGYDERVDLTKIRLLEPSFGEGDFLVPAARRLLNSWQTHNPNQSPHSLKNCIRGVELHEYSFSHTYQKLAELFYDFGIAEQDTSEILSDWLVFGDFLLAPLEGTFDIVVGNPPYVRQEDIPDALIQAYRLRYKTIFDRADLYIPFYERSLLSLSNAGKLAFICADRWTKNRYGGPLRALIAKQFHLSAYIDMDGTSAFHDKVSAYPAITVIHKRPSADKVTRFAKKPEIASGSLKVLAAALSGETKSRDVQAIVALANNDDPWLFGEASEMSIVKKLEQQFPLIESTGCKIGIGVATGADKVFIGDFDTLDVESDRKLPLAMTRDIRSGKVEWRGLGVINPYGDDGKLVDLAAYPKMKAYLEAHYAQVAKRHVAKKSPANWYKTIDRIYPELVSKPKLLIPDIKGKSHIVYDEGQLYPHHNLYYVVSDDWDLRALQAVLLSCVTRLMITTYSTKMRGGYLRFQAQYLRRLRLPKWNDVSPDIRVVLCSAAKAHDIGACNEAAFKLYGLSEADRLVLNEGAANGA